MFTLHIGGKPATIKKGNTIKITRENPFFTGSGDYTLDITLPLKGCPGNQKIFGCLHRQELPENYLPQTRFEARILTGQLEIIGTAAVLNVTNEEVKIQMTAGRTDLRHVLDTLEEECVCDVKLGKVWSELPAFRLDEGGWTQIEKPQDACLLFHGHHLIQGNDGKEYNVQQIMHGDYTQTSAVVLPLYSTANEMLANKCAFQKVNDQYQYTLVRNLQNGNYATITPMPYLYHVVRIFVEHFGYQFEDRLQPSHPFHKLIIVNSFITLDVNEMLPKWSPAKFIQEVENLLGIIFNVEGKTVAVMELDEFLQGHVNFIKQATDERTTEVNKDQATDSSSLYGNVDYGWDDIDASVRLPEEVWENADVIRMDNLQEIQAHFNALGQQEKETSRFLYLNRANGNVYAILHPHNTANEYSLVRVDQFGPLIREEGSRSINIVMEMVPAGTTIGTDPATGSYEGSEEDFTESTDIAKGIPTLATANQIMSINKHYSVDIAINSEGDETNTVAERPDKLLVAIYDPAIAANPFVQAWDGKKYPIAIGQPYIRHPESNLPVCPENIHVIGTTDIGPDFFSLCNKEQSSGIAGCLGKSPNVDTRVIHEFEFLDNITRPDGTFIIRGRKYLCQKIELTLDEDGLQPLKKGYFFESCPRNRERT